MERAYLNLISGRTRGPVASLARAALSAAAGGFEAAARLRGYAYDQSWKSARQTSIPVISIGNLTAGGTGKTPVVAWLANRFAERGRAVAILSRGYGASKGEWNDEGLLLKALCPEARLYQNPDRVTSAQHAARTGSHLALLDDGFQHRRLARDFDLVIVDATRPFGYGSLLPRGLLREPPSALQRADAVLISRAELCSKPQLQSLKERLSAYGAPALCLELRFAPHALRAVTGRATHPPSWLKGRSVAAACGIGNPEAFRRGLEKSLGARLVTWQPFSDHHGYARGELDTLLAASRAAGAEALIVTAKDAVKLASLLEGQQPPLPVLALDITPQIEKPEQLLSAIDEATARHVNRGC
jgi:tetraacyldisaccharide 4'-kinase